MSFPWRWARRAVGFAAACYVGLHIRIPGIRPELLSRGFWNTNDSALLRLLDKMTGNGISGGKVLALGIAPYLSARLYFWIAKKVSPRFAAMDSNDVGRDTLTRWTRVLTVVLALVQSYGYAQFMQAAPNVVVNPGPKFVAMTMALLTIASVAVMRLSERIEETNDDEEFASTHTTSSKSLDSAHAPAALNAPQFADEILIKRVVQTPVEVNVPK